MPRVFIKIDKTLGEPKEKTAHCPNPMEQNHFDQIRKYLKKNLSGDRFFHSVEVAKIAQKICEKQRGLNPQKAYLAGLVHDCARDLPQDTLWELAKKYRIKIDAFTKTFPLLLHAPVGARLAYQNWNIRDKEILQAISKHCVPKIYMDRLDKIIYLADVIAPTPKVWAGLKVTLPIAFKSLDLALLSAYNENIKHFVQTDKAIHPDLIKARNRLLENLHKKILILGARGMLGTALCQTFKDYLITCWDQADVDLTDRPKLQRKISALKPQIIINAAAYTKVDDAEAQQQNVLKVNGKAVGNLAVIAKRIGAILVHFSTDYVFDGKKRKGYKESDQPNPINVYGKSKFLGEALLRRNTDQYYLIRSSWLFGPHGINFVQKMLQLANNNVKLKVVNDQWGKPTYTQDLAERTKQLLEHDKPFGIYHITNEGKTTWYQFAKKIFKLANVKPQIQPISSQEYKAIAPRPLHSALLNTKLPKLRRWEEALEEYLNFSKI